MIYFILGIFIFNLLLFYLLKNIKRFLLVGSVITILSGYLVILCSYLLRKYIHSNFRYINISILTNYILDKNISNGLVLILFGSIQLIMYVIMLFINRKEELINNSSVNSLT